jgi:hypothetical protein
MAHINFKGGFQVETESGHVFEDVVRIKTKKKKVN